MRTTHAAVESLKRSIEQGAIIVGIGPFTNLMLLEKAYPGILKQANLYLMGGYVFDIPTGYPHDPLACAIALGWREGVEIETVPLTYETREGWLYEIPDPDGTPTRLVTKIDGRAFDEFWYEMLCR